MKWANILISAALLIVSCAPISEDQCRGGDWGSIGLADGKAGKSVSILEKYAETCAEFGISPDQNLYLQARKSGLQFYCTPQNAYKVGREGARLNTVCEPAVQSQIRPAYDRGNKYYEINRDIEKKEDRIDELQDSLRADFSDPLTPEQVTQRQLIRSKIRDLEHDIFVLEIRRKRFDSWP